MLHKSMNFDFHWEESILKFERNMVIQESCELLDCKNNNNGNCACINMLHNPEYGVECDSYIPEED